MGFFSRNKNDDARKQAPKAKSEKPKAEEKAEESKKEAAKAVLAPRETGAAYRVLVRPIVTEKSSALGHVNQYVFEVASSANKIEIRKAVKSVYGVAPVGVNIITVLGKPVRSRAGMVRRSNWRKAIVTLKKGDRIDLYAAA